MPPGTVAVALPLPMLTSGCGFHGQCFPTWLPVMDGSQNALLKKNHKVLWDFHNNLRLAMLVTTN